METYHSLRNNDIESVKAQWSQFDNSDANESVIDDDFVEMQSPQGAEKNGGPRIIIKERGQVAEESSITLINDLLNPFSSFVRYLSNKGYIGKIDNTDPNGWNAKLLA